MSLILHIMRKDARRIWPLAGAWAALIATGFLLVALWSGVTLRFVTIETMPILFGGLVIIQQMAAYLLTAVLWHEDPAVGSRMRWATRPVSGRQLLAAKLAGTVLWFWVIPLALALPCWRACGFGRAELAAAAGYTLAMAAMPTILALPLAVLSEDLSHFLWYTLLAVMAGVVDVVVSLAITVRGTLAGEPRVVDLDVWLVVAVALAVAVHQYLTRRTARTTVLFLGGTALIVGLSGWGWAPGGIKTWAGGPAAPANESAGIRVVLRRATVTEARQGAKARGERLTLDLGIAGVPSDCRALVESVTLEGKERGTVLAPSRPAEVSWMASDGHTEHLIKQGIWTGDSAWFRPVAEAACGVAPAREHMESLRVQVTLPEAAAAELKRHWSDTTVRLRTRLMRCVVAGEVPVRPGAAVTAGSLLIRVEEVHWVGDAAMIWWLERGPAQSRAGGVWGRRGDVDTFWILDRRERELVPVSRPPWRHWSVPYNGIRLGGYFSAVPEGTRPADWLKDAVLAKLAIKDAGGFGRTLALPPAVGAGTPALP